MSAEKSRSSVSQGMTNFIGHYRIVGIQNVSLKDCVQLMMASFLSTTPTLRCFYSIASWHRVIFIQLTDTFIQLNALLRQREQNL